jgi:hypothetical protein
MATYNHDSPPLLSPFLTTTIYSNLVYITPVSGTIDLQLIPKIQSPYIKNPTYTCNWYVVNNLLALTLNEKTLKLLYSNYAFFGSVIIFNNNANTPSVVTVLSRNEELNNMCKHYRCKDINGNTTFSFDW